VPAQILAIAGIPPILLNTVAYVAEKQGYFEKHNVAVTLKPFQTGADVARAVQSGQASAGFVGTPTIIDLDSSGGTLTAILGFPHPDMLIGSTDAKVKDCASLKGQTIAVDGIGAPKDLALTQMLAACHLSRNDVKPLPIGGNAQAEALIAGQLTTSVLHIDDLPTINAQLGGKKAVEAVVRLAELDPLAHWDAVTTTRERLKDPAQREALTRMVAALHDAIVYMHDTANADSIAETATAMNKSKVEVTKPSLQGLIKLGVYPLNDAGLPEAGLAHTIQQEVEVGNVKAANAPKVTDVADPSLYEACCSAKK
jgi:NitT/TauT family transport system substrate-binding protein